MSGALKEAGNQLAHFFVTGGFALIPLAFADSSISVFFAFSWAGLWIGIIREDAQHRDSEGWGWITEGTWTGRYLDIASHLAIGVTCGAVAAWG